mmetsp:Transcript_13429/g.26680  ORF Transcript_13429/g.26680 Transcript_13429/m.26680 type:complete len:261 (-) Transcript_13429:49-831(-)
MIGSETCVTNCCGTDITCNETSRTQNHKFLYFTGLLYVVIAIVVITIGSQNLLDGHLLELFPYSTPIIITCNSLAGLLVLLSIVGIVATRNRYKHVLVLWLFLNTILSVTEIITASMLQTTLSDSEFDAYVSTSYLQNWKTLVASAETDSSALSWVQSAQNSGSCCGWLDSTDVSENPAWLNCPTTNAAVCSTYFKSNISSLFGHMQTVMIALSVVQLVVNVTTYALVCRLKEFYKSEDIDYGDYIHVPFGKVRTLDDMM